MVVRTYSAILVNEQPQLIEVEISSRQGIPQLIVIGLASQALHEARERLLSALSNCQVRLKSKRTIINLSPAELKKTSACLDLAMAVGLLQVAQVIPPLPDKIVWLGELALDGSLKSSPEISSLLGKIHDPSLTAIITPEVKLAGLRPTYTLSTLSRLISLKGNISLLPHVIPQQPTNTTQFSPDFADIQGQALAKRALILGLTGHHHCLLSGPPGVGKTMLLSAVASLAHGINPNVPLCQPHHTISSQGLVGGGNATQPGDITRAHQGLLILDEIAEFPRSALEALREPLTSGKITLSRSGSHRTLPANFLLFAAMNGCPCGYSGSTQRDKCHCSPTQIEHYQQRISGALLDRIPIQCQLNEERGPDDRATSAEISRQIKVAQEKQRLRFAASPLSHNGQLSIFDLKKYCHVSKAAQQAITELSTHHSSWRQLNHLVALSQTIADLENSAEITLEHLQEAQVYQTLSADH